MKKIVLEMDENMFYESCVKMTTLGGLPLNVFDRPGLVDIFSRIEGGLGVGHLNRNNVTGKIASVADQFKVFIRNELKGRKVCLKMDEASRRGRSVLGVNIQFLERKKIIVRTLGLIDLEIQHTAENIKKEVLKLIGEYNLTLDQIYTVTTDNGANFIKAVELLRREIARYRQTRSADELLDSDDEFDHEEQTESVSDYEDEVEDYVDSEDDNEKKDEDEIEKASTMLGGVRCVAHTLQLAVHDCIKECKLKKGISNVRQAVKTLKKFPFKSFFKKEGKKMPFLDVETRWNSAYLMECIVDTIDKQTLCATNLAGVNAGRRNLGHLS